MSCCASSAFLDGSGKETARSKVRCSPSREGTSEPAAATPFIGRKRITVLIDALDKGGTKEERKLGVTPRMMHWLKGELRPAVPKGVQSREERRESLDAAVLWAALTTGFFYLCRAKELGDIEETPAQGAPI